MSDDDKLNKESQLNIGIYAIRVSLYNNLGKPVDLNSKMFVFPDGSSLTSELNNHPYLSSNIKYNTRKLDKMTHQECIQTFFNKRAFINFLRDEQIIDYEPTENEETNDQEKPNENRTVQENVETMLEYMFPMSFPVIKIVKRKSAPMALGFIKAFKKEFFKKKFNTFLNIGGKTNTVDGVTILDTFSTNPVYIKAFEIIQKYKQQIIPAHEELFKKLQTLHTEFSTAVTELKRKIDNNNKDPTFNAIGDIYFNKTYLNLIKVRDEMQLKMDEIMNLKIKQKNFSSNFKKISDALKSYAEYLDEKTILLITNVKDKKIEKDDSIKSNDRNFYDTVYVKLYKLANIKKLVKVCYFLTLIPYIETYRDNLSNYDISPIADLKKYGFHKKTIDDFTQYYFPKRMTLNEYIQPLFNTGIPGNEIEIVEIEKMFNDRTKQRIRIDVDKIELNSEDRNNPRYNIQVQISIFGGMVSDRIKKFIKCIYEERKIGADITRYIINSEQSEYFDLTSEIAKIEKKMAATQKGQNNKLDKAPAPITAAPVQGIDGKRDYVNPANPNTANVGENTKQESNKSLTITDTHESIIDSYFRESSEFETKKYDGKKELAENEITYVPFKSLKNIGLPDLMKELRSDSMAVKYINLSFDDTVDMNIQTNSSEETTLHDDIVSKLERKMKYEKQQRDESTDPIIKQTHENKFSVYYFLIKIIKKIHDKNQINKNIYKERKEDKKAKTGGRKTRRKRNFLRKTRKH
jgi:hypothetical protein